MQIETTTTVTVTMSGREADLIAAALTTLKDSPVFINGQTITKPEKEMIADMRRHFIDAVPDGGC